MPESHVVLRAEEKNTFSSREEKFTLDKFWPYRCSGARRQNKVLDEVSAAIIGGVAAENAKDELTQKPPNTLNLQKIGSAFVVSSILGVML